MDFFADIIEVQPNSPLDNNQEQIRKTPFKSQNELPKTKPKIQSQSWKLNH